METSSKSDYVYSNTILRKHDLPFFLLRFEVTLPLYLVPAKHTHEQYGK